MTTRRDFLRSVGALGGVPLLSSLGIATEALAQGTAGEYERKPLPFLPEALEPHLDARTLRIHHLKYYGRHVVALNRTLKKLHEARDSADYGDIQALSRELALHAGGYVNHVIYFDGMAPVNRGGGQKPVGELGERIAKDFGSFEKFKAHFTAAAVDLESNGWVVLGYHPIIDRLLVMQMIDENELNTLGLVPLVMIDMWEHAYFLKYQYKRDEYVKAWWNVVYWKDAARRYVIAAV